MSSSDEGRVRESEDTKQITPREMLDTSSNSVTATLRKEWSVAKANAIKERRRQHAERKRNDEEDELRRVRDNRGVKPETTRPDGRVCYIGSQSNMVECAARGEFDRAIDFIDNGDDLDALHEQLGVSALHAAAEFGHIQIVRALLNAGCDPNVRTRETGRTAVHLAAANNRVDIILELVRNGGADKFLRDRAGKLPIDLAIEFQKHDAEKALWDLPDTPKSLAVRYAIDYEVSHKLLTHCKIPHDGGAPIDAFEFAISKMTSQERERGRGDHRDDDDAPELDSSAFEPWQHQTLRPNGDGDACETPRTDDVCGSDSSCTPKEAAARAAHVAAVAAAYSNCYDCAVRKWMARLDAGEEVDPDCADGHGIISHADPTWVHVVWDGIEPYTLYRFRVRVHNPLGWTAWSDVVTKRTKVAIPDVPGQPYSTATTPTCIVLDWNTPCGNGLPILDYLVQWSREGVGRVWTGWRRLRIVQDAHIRLNSLASDRGYKFRVSARNEMGSSAWSEPSKVIVTFQAIDVVEVDATSIAISWANLGYCSTSDVDKYEMQVMDALHKTWTTYANDLTGTSARAENLRPYRLYLLRVRPHSTLSGWKDWSDCVATEPIRTLEAAPFAPTGLRFEDIRHDALLVRWDVAQANGSEVDGYSVRYASVFEASDRQTNKIDDDRWQTVESDLCCATLTSLPCDTIVRVQVRAHCDSCGWGSYGDVVTARTMSLPAPSRPRLDMRRLDSIARVTWNAPSPIPDDLVVVRYELQIRHRDQDVKTWTVVSDKIPGDVTSMIIDDLASSRGYYYRVRAFSKTTAGVAGASHFSEISDLIATRRAL